MTKPTYENAAVIPEDRCPICDRPCATEEEPQDAMMVATRVLRILAGDDGLERNLVSPPEDTDA